MTDDTPPDVAAILEPLKGFQQRTARYVFNRLYTDDDYTRRFLIADEVGLGKTLVARGVIAQAIDHLWVDEDIDRIDVVYVCSNASIARQNIDRLVLSEDDDHAYSSRITMLPTQAHTFEENRVNFISFTPGTSFDLKSNLGRMQERVVLYHLLREPWTLEGMAPLNVLRGRAGHRRFRRAVRDFDAPLDEGLAAAFTRALADRPELEAAFEDLCGHYVQYNSRVSDAVKRKRRQVIGEIRNVLATVCVDALEPDLIILDEFQRFKHLLEGASDEGDLAQRLFNYSDENAEARVLLLSATPYKMYTMAHETEDDHLADFVRTLAFLAGNEAASEIRELLDEYRRSMFQQPGDLGGQTRELKRTIEARLRRVMVRTERLAASPDRNGMVQEIPATDIELQPVEVMAYLELEAVNELLEGPAVMSYWKSSPYLLNFMNNYSLKRKFRRARDEEPLRTQLFETLAGDEYLDLPVSAIESYRPVDLRNARLRTLVDDLVETGAWRLLWIPPSLPYYEPGFPFDQPGLSTLTKRLVFSAWRVVPKSIAAMVSYEVERRIMADYDPDATYSVGRSARGYLLQITEDNERLTGMPLFTLLYPSAVLATIGDPATIGTEGGEPPEQAVVTAEIADRIRARLDPLIDRYAGTRADPSHGAALDQSWYWAAPLLLDLEADHDGTRAWLLRSDLPDVWMGDTADDADSGEFQHWKAHVKQFRAAVTEEVRLGTPPDDLLEVLTDIALGGPATCALRALTRAIDTRGVSPQSETRTRAAQVGWAFRMLFNDPESTSLVRGVYDQEPYWRRVPEYCRDGNLQAVLDEWVHLLNDFGLEDAPRNTVVKTIAEEMVSALGLRTATARIDDIQLADGKITLPKKGIRCHFALQFGDVEDFDTSEAIRTDQVRRAFNSPFWPFVLATTSVGQEGLDFHQYCHAVVHWNLPSNPVDLEQREGRVHRFKGHAVRKNVATAYGREVRKQPPDGALWPELFDRAAAVPGPGDSELVPYWVFTNDNGQSAFIERHVPVLPLSRDERRLTELKQSLAVYRLAFGQPRQDDLVEYLLRHLSADELRDHLDELRIDLTPPAQP